jgi:hypothetical protein
VAEAVEIEPVSRGEFAENREKYRETGICKTEMMLPTLKSAAFTGLSAKMHVKINRETYWPYQGNVDQITG